MRDVGLIVLDEEHDAAYKQDADPRYDARTVAAKRAALEGAVAVYGSATPRPESWERLERLELAGRIGAPLPRVRIVDLRREAGYPLSAPLLARARRDRGERWPRDPAAQPARRRARRPLPRLRPIAPLRLVRRRADAARRRSAALPPLRLRGARARGLPACGSVELARVGAGTQRLETELAKHLPELERIRLDADTTARARRAPRRARALRAADRAVLIGTQMVAKGHHFPGVRLAAVVDADTGLALPDLRAEERTFQLVTQLAGRSGRDAPGLVLVQTFQPDATPLVYAARHDVSGFLAQELERRRELAYPPYQPPRLARRLRARRVGAGAGAARDPRAARRPRRRAARARAAAAPARPAPVRSSSPRRTTRAGRTRRGRRCSRRRRPRCAGTGSRRSSTSTRSRLI